MEAAKVLAHTHSGDHSMEKLVYLVHQSADQPGADLRGALIEKATPALRAAGATQISISVDDEDVAQGTGVLIRHSDPPIRACVSFWMQSADDRALCEAALAAEAESLAGYLVVESRPVVHTPPVGERAPGANLVTCLRRLEGLSDADFIHRWHTEHKEVANAIQSTFAYVRNVVVRKLTSEGPDWEGIVEESFPIEALVNPRVWYDCDTDDEQQRRAKQMVDSVRAFLDLRTLESTPMSEYYLG
jgi:hypothetical protein